MKTNLTKYILFSLMLLCFFFQMIFCQTDTSTYVLNPDEYVAQQIFDKRIVVLGDFAHHTSYSLHTLFQVLEAWKREMDKSDKICKLTLVLEQSSDNGTAIEKYIKSTRVENPLKVFLIESNIEDLEFLEDLKNLYVDIAQSRVFSEGRISLKIKGFEENMNDPEFAKMNLEERDMWFIQKRDLNISDRLIEYMSENPDEKILMFYGNGHLINGLIRKDYHTYTIKDSISGYYLSYYLKEKFSPSQVLTVCQLQFRDDLFSIPFYDYNGREEIYLTASNAKWKELKSEYYDAVLIRKQYRQFHPHPLSFIFSASLTERIINALKILELKNELYFNQLLNYSYIYPFFGIIFRDAESLNNWFKIYKNYINPDSLSNNILRERIFNSLYSGKPNYQIRTLMESLGFPNFLLNPLPDSTRWESDIWPEGVKHMKFISFLANYWIGNEEEKLSAKKYLKGFSNEDFEDAGQYFKWYRKKYYDYDF